MGNILVLLTYCSYSLCIIPFSSSFFKTGGTSGADTITDLTVQAEDKLDLSSFGISTKSKALDIMTDDGSGNNQVTIDGDLIVTLNDTTKTDLSGYDFLA